MKPFKAQFYIYAEDEAEVTSLEEALLAFVMAQYNKGFLVTAGGLARTLNKNKDNPLVTALLRNGKQ